MAQFVAALQQAVSRNDKSAVGTRRMGQAIIDALETAGQPAGR